MANQPTDMLAREIDEELRREQILKLWDKYGVYALAAIVALVIGVGGWKWYQYQQATANEAASTQFIVALGDLASKRSFDGQKRLDELAAKAPAGYASLARLRLAAQEGSQGNVLEALTAYDKIARDETVDPILQDFARLQIAMLKFDSASFTELRNQLSSLASDRSPWRYSARELLGMGAMKAGYLPEARNHFQRLLSDRSTPPGVADRVRVLVAILDESERAAGSAVPGVIPGVTPGARPGAEQKPETPSKADAGGDKAKVAPGQNK